MIEQPYRRRPLRLRNYDYSQIGAYFVTICTFKREHILGCMVNGNFSTNRWGNIVSDSWNELPAHYSSIQLDAFVVMPNHIHGIILIGRPESCHTNAEPTPVQKFPSLGNIIGYYKYHSTKLINECRRTTGVPIWQRGYYEHIIRNEADMNRIREYIETNPLRWHLDRENFKALNKDDFDLWLGSFHTKPKP